ncbi:2-oxoacid:acceptor oxidoreductase family protein [Effusibacillus lacus]|uniref:Ferredoxin n=1 Tax=Effusibacillus lacus TaxID=1348429 RepID=A0A292YIW2_9BACL|nr:2-oxoacid:acceptor oxidoreductase family protein [Effusibacillus lacus]TCS74425.1 pyruvate ferredoxin oxidoreductase gamma subunit [Effusibacillus lacus]GAX88703.1 ferredoxin [Effusibacillus lacus]
MAAQTTTRLTKVNELGLFEIRLESIGGLGANLAGKMLAEAGVIHLGLNGSNFSSYGSEKKGSPVKTFIRYANPETNLRAVSPVEEPHVVGVFHEALFKTQNCISGLQPDGILLVNTTKTPDEIREITGLKTGTIVCVDALGIAVEEKTRVNTAMLGALCREVDFLDPKAVEFMIRETFEKKYPALVDSNIRTFERGYSEVISKTYEPEPGAKPETFVRPQPMLGYETQPIGGVIINPGNSILKDLSSSRQGFLPSFNREACIHCAACDQVCPDYCFVWAQETDAKGRVNQYLQGIDYQYCKGCQKCVEACPTEALSTLREMEGYAEQNGVKHRFNIA